MKYHNITHDDMLNGQGLRVVLWVSGCNHRCDECQNPITWDVNNGVEFDEDAEKELLDDLKKNYVEGVNFEYGTDKEVDGVIVNDKCKALAKKIKDEFPSKDIWLYTGYLWEEIKDLEIVKYIDVLVDGPFKKEVKDVKLHWKGSANQRVNDVKKTMDSGKVVVLED